MPALAPLPYSDDLSADPSVERQIRNEEGELSRAHDLRRPGERAFVARPDRSCRDKSTVLVGAGSVWRPAVDCYDGNHRVRAEEYARRFNSQEGT